jgi:hypothetical protein
VPFQTRPGFGYLTWRFIYKNRFPIERSIGLFSEDGKCELSLDVWKHPERKALIEYNISIETNQEVSKESRGRVYVIFHGEKIHTGKLLLSEVSNEHKMIESHEIKAIDVGKVNGFLRFKSRFMLFSLIL